MLGRTILDPLKVESSTIETDGLGLLDVNTEMAVSKTLRQVKLPDNIEGYEIHHGKTSVGSGDVYISSGEKVLGVRNGHIEGTYLHGIFDNDIYRLNFLNELRVKNGLSPKTEATIYNLEPAFDRLAQTVREHVDLEKIYGLMGL